MRDNLEEKIYDLENNFRQCDEYLETIDKNIEDIKRKYVMCRKLFLILLVFL